MAHKTAVILLNYKDYAVKFLKDCRDSLLKTNFGTNEFVVYIVDNESSDGSFRYLQTNYPEAKIIANKTNDGWSGGNNIAARQALADGCDFLAFINMDLIVEPDWLANLVNTAHSSAEVGIVQSKILIYPPDADGTVRINSVGNHAHFLGFGFCDGYKVINYRDDVLKEITVASGSSFLVKKEVFEKIGFFDDDLFMYYDDQYFGLKARLAGYKIILAPTSIVWHKYHFDRSIKQVYFMERNRILMMLYFYKLPTLLLILPAFIIFEFGILLFSIKGHWFRQKIKTWLYFFHLNSWKKIFIKRREIFSIRKMGDREFSKTFVSKVIFQEVANPLLDRFANPIMTAYWLIVKKIIFW